VFAFFYIFRVASNETPGRRLLKTSLEKQHETTPQNDRKPVPPSASKKKSSVRANLPIKAKDTPAPPLVGVKISQIRGSGHL
jgi:hypothetical protein